ncbi:hypothetical protein DOE63_31330 [Salmonella enterica subsp. diarizonae serovar 59:z10:-]|nr:hypothetical protein DOE63_31330 [Salmonella enterica subsp. diarizonae serovar 59:z10:-]
MKILIYIGETQLTINKDNREVAHSIAKEIAKEYFLDENHKVNFSYSKEYYAIILSDKTNVSIDIEKIFHQNLNSIKIFVLCKIVSYGPLKSVHPNSVDMVLFQY